MNGCWRILTVDLLTPSASHNFNEDLHLGVSVFIPCDPVDLVLCLLSTNFARWRPLLLAFTHRSTLSQELDEGACILDAVVRLYLVRSAGEPQRSNTWRVTQYCPLRHTGFSQQDYKSQVDMLPSVVRRSWITLRLPAQTTHTQLQAHRRGAR